MRHDQADFQRLIGELGGDLLVIEDLFSKNRRMTTRLEAGTPDEFDWAALGYTLHNLYCAFEGYFLRVAKFFENSLDAMAWHKDLVDRMTIAVSGLRPCLFPREYARRMDELRRFRHAFRNVYLDELDPRRLSILNGDIPALVSDFRPYHDRFIDALTRIASGLDR